jgi:hypothetical protein
VSLNLERPNYALIYSSYYFCVSYSLNQTKGNVDVVGRVSDTDSLFDEAIATFEDDGGAYNQQDAEGCCLIVISSGINNIPI